MPNIMLLVLSALILALLATTTTADHPGCKKAEREALLQFKGGLKDPAGRLSSWVGRDCCLWPGIACSNRTGHVTRIDLRTNYDYDFDLELQHYDNSALAGSISSSLLALRHLRYLDLSCNNFTGNSIPSFIGSLSRLNYLNLSRTSFSGKVPDQIGNLSRLQHLDLSWCRNPYMYLPYLHVDNAEWLSRLASLQHLDMSYSDFGNESGWLQALNALPSIREIHLGLCRVAEFPLTLHQVNFTSLAVLELFGVTVAKSSTLPSWLFNITSLEYLNLNFNQFNGLIPASIGNMTSLRYLDLGDNELHGPIPASIGGITALSLLDLSYNHNLRGTIPTELGNLCSLRTLRLSSVPINATLDSLDRVFSVCVRESLEELDLTSTQLSGSMPDWIGEVTRMKYLGLSGNTLHSSLPVSIGTLSSLQVLVVSDNQLNGTITEAHFAKLASLKEVYIYGNSFILQMSPSWTPPFQLEIIDMQFCQLGPKFPTWLGTQVSLQHLDLRDTRIRDTIPEWFRNISSNLVRLDMSNNEISGQLPQFHLLQLETLDLSNNSMSGPIPPSFWDGIPNLHSLDLSHNNINSSIPFSLCLTNTLHVLRLSKSNLQGGIPSCWRDSSHLQVFDASHNNLSGEIPEAMGNLHSLSSLHLSNNNLHGQLPASLQSCESLVTLDLGYNQLSGNIPHWTTKSLLNLKILSLRRNIFTGPIPELSLLVSLQILDLSSNSLSGTIPTIYGNFMRIIGNGDSPDHGILFEDETTDYVYHDDIELYLKGRELEYTESLALVMLIDLSNNGLSGHIPEELCKLNGLLSLNLSRNHLTGEIPTNISGLKNLESLDLSNNNLTGAIPSGMTAMTFLSTLNLAHNDLSGRIPTGNQFDTFITDPLIYTGNPALCGRPLNVTCEGTETEATKTVGGDEDDDEGKHEAIWLYTSVILGFLPGFWLVWGVLAIKKEWRVAYFRAADNFYDMAYVMIVVNSARLKRKITKRE